MENITYTLKSFIVRDGTVQQEQPKKEAWQVKYVISFLSAHYIYVGMEYTESNVTLTT